MHRTVLCFVPCMVAVLSAGATAQDLLVSSRFSNNVLRYDGATGAFKNVFASDQVANPNGIALGADGLLVAMGDVSEILLYSAPAGDLLSEFIPAGTGGLKAPRDILLHTDGNLYVCSGIGDEVLRFDGTTGAFIDVFATAPSDWHSNRAEISSFPARSAGT